MLLLLLLLLLLLYSNMLLLLLLLRVTCACLHKLLLSKSTHIRLLAHVYTCLPGNYALLSS
jgi:hypothetical protein